MRQEGVYMIQSITHPERIYVGSALNLRNRESAHRTDLLRGSHVNPKLQFHYNEYGENDLIFEVLESGDYFCKNHRLAREQGWMAHFAYNGTGIPYFNIVPVAGSCQGRVLSDETKKKIGDKSRNRSNESNQKIGDQLRGRKRTPEAVEKSASKLRGVPSKKKGKPSGLVPWNKGMTGIKLNLTEGQRAKRSQRSLGNKSWSGKSLSKEHKQHISDGWARRRALKNKQVNI